MQSPESHCHSVSLHGLNVVVVVMVVVVVVVLVVVVVVVVVFVVVFSVSGVPNSLPCLFVKETLVTEDGKVSIMWNSLGISSL